MAGADNNRVHAYNPVYRHPGIAGVAPRFASFPMNVAGGLPNPGGFINGLVAQVPPPIAPLAIRFDHQGHIVPQNMMNIVLDGMMLEMSNVCANAAQVNTYIAHAPHNAAWMADAVAYGNAFGMPMFDFSVPLILNNLANAEARLGNLFSIFTWNPVNICRAPGDIYRNGVPGENIDAPVLAWLNLHPAGVNTAWLAAVNVLAALPAPTPAQIRTYLAACTATLPAQQVAATGYYSFPWRVGPGAAGLIP